ncbi:hypothetical protein VN12_25460 [Pirellula sp. SH-Sr6A]|uniref:hypothetical protein n=1 Tax=Pirellula sp. SH-Sr6A TaxID=1632865 RepID=UPI00078CA54F|nr:hypothetical protein [Pirellula sp. SH-Sr6A]AMV35464.1 hypothetical protein VN12_25460 [Pirellula sp. SH-Sr6A]
MKKELVCALLAFGFCSQLCNGQSPGSDPKNASAAPKLRTVARLFWQDTSTQSVRWGDLQRSGEAWQLDPQPLASFPSLNLDNQSLVQMEAIDQVLLVGIHDKEKGSFESGWVAFESGVTKEEHGDHFHWHYDTSPTLLAKQLDKEQGNPAHVYQYNQLFVIANDALSGFTVVDPYAIRAGRSNMSRFYSGGGNHITLAAPSREVVYATWVDRDGDNMGRIDVVSTGGNAEQKGYSFKLPTGGLHGATANAGRIFFAPADGICSVRSDSMLQEPPTVHAIEHISLGMDSVTGRPNRTGAFVNHRNYVLFTYGSGTNSQLGMIDASASRLELRQVAIPTGEGLALVSPKTATTRAGKEIAFVVQDRRQSEAQESLAIIDLDPNGDKRLEDATIFKTLELAPSKIEGHSGHHEICFLPENRLACVSNPGDGSIWLISMNDFAVQARLSVGGSPGRLIAQ